MMDELPRRSQRFGRGLTDDEARATNQSPEQVRGRIAAFVRMVHDPRPNPEILADEAAAYLAEVGGYTR